MDSGEAQRLELIKLLIRTGVSLTVLIVAAYIILSNQYPDATIKWAFTVAGVVVGYWLR